MLSCKNTMLEPAVFFKMRNLFHLVEKMKEIMRHQWTSNGRQESVAEHCWRLSFIILVCSKYFDQKIDIEKSLKMALIHDLAEVMCGDVPYFLAKEGSAGKKRKQEKEISAMNELKDRYKELQTFDELHQLWQEYEEGISYEAKVVKAIDKIEAQLQQNEADLSTWLPCEEADATEGYINKFCEFDSFLAKLSQEIVKESQELVASNKEINGKLNTC